MQIMGIFSLDLSKDVDLTIHAEDPALQEILTVISKYASEEASSLKNPEEL